MSITAPEIGFRLESTLTTIAERIREEREKRLRVAGILAGLKGVSLEGVDGLVESSLLNRVEPDPLTRLTVVGVDGGLLVQQLHGVDLILTRALAVVFRYSNAELKQAWYLPSRAPPPKLIDVTEPLDARELESLASMERQMVELEVATDEVSKADHGALLLDGSVVPQYVDRFSHNPLLLERHQRLIEKYVKLYRACAESETLLAGVVKDCRGARFVELLRRRVLPTFGGIGFDPELLAALEHTRDTALLDCLLEVGERTAAFTYAESQARHVLEDLGEWSGRINAFYIKTVPFDQPLRVEFVDWTDGPADTAAAVASIVYALSPHHHAFGLPSVLIEADVCARLAEEDLQLVRDGIADKLGLGVVRGLRRRRKPF
jgi:hypothetical protein